MSCRGPRFLDAVGCCCWFSAAGVRRRRRRNASSATSSRRPTTCPTRSPASRTPTPRAAIADLETRWAEYYRLQQLILRNQERFDEVKVSVLEVDELEQSMLDACKRRCAEIMRVENLRGLPREFWQSFMKCYMDEVVAIVSEPGIVGACSVDEIRGMQQLYNEQGFERVIWVELNVVPKEFTQRMLERVQQAAPGARLRHVYVGMDHTIVLGPAADFKKFCAAIDFGDIHYADEGQRTVRINLDLQKLAAGPIRRQTAASRWTADAATAEACRRRSSLRQAERRAGTAQQRLAARGGRRHGQAFRQRQGRAHGGPRPAGAPRRPAVHGQAGAAMRRGPEAVRVHRAQRRAVRRGVGAGVAVSAGDRLRNRHGREPGAAAAGGVVRCEAATECRRAARGPIARETPSRPPRATCWARPGGDPRGAPCGRSPSAASDNMPVDEQRRGEVAKLLVSLAERFRHAGPLVGHQRVAEVVDA